MDCCKKPSDFRSPLAKVRGLGAAHSGTGHASLQRLTALFIAPLALWCLFSLLATAAHGSEEALRDWFASSLHSAGLLLLLGAAFWHARLGVQVIVEDYVHCPYMKRVLLTGNLLAALAMALLTLLSVITLHLHH